MNKLIELSVRGSVYFYLSSAGETRLNHLRQFARQFYMSDPAHEHMSDEEIAGRFTSAAEQAFGVGLKSIPVAAVLVIK